MGPARIIVSIIALCSTTVLAYPSHQRLHRKESTTGQPLDEGYQPICLPIPTTLTSNEDLIAKVRPRDGDTCEASESILMRRADDPYACDESKPCSNGACCAKSGFCGYGEKYCGTNGESPNDVCWSNCDAHAECGRHAEEKGQTCPLNVCCSEFGFCGMTSEFCTESDVEGEGCQSNCKQPGSGSSGGDVQKRVIGYYEAWNYKKKCIGMGMDDIPVNSLTHIYYSFAYIQPDSYDIIPMDDEKDGKLSTDTFKSFAGLKRKNSELKVIVALGGWTFNDNHTIYQPVFSDLSSTEAKRSKFIDKLKTFMTRYGFDGVDIDWEYPGAGDRGGHDEDGVNFTKLLKQMRQGFDDMAGSHKEISFTAPTSYWYLRHFDLEASAKAVDYVNVMSYDLHGIWDSDNPIGSQVLAHTNLTEIDLALNLFWRNNVDPAKINLGLGFYGRSFQLADPACYKPGCVFKGGASPGPCTDNSGTLSYFEIMDIIEKYDLTPYYDEENAVKYVTWNGDQWVSYDDFDTFQQKIDFGNSLGLGGLLIWAIDLDTKDLDALSAVLYPESLGTNADRSTVDNWEDLDKAHCRATECGSTGCGPGEIEIKQPQCNTKFEKKSICCPFASAPDPDKCHWRGNDPWCNGRCHDGEVAIQSSLYGSGGRCSDGRKFLCCEAEATMPDCRWTECNDDCNSDENEMTWRYNTCGVSGAKKKFCCSKEQEWKNCKWHGKPGSCFDNHCDTGWQVALTTNFEGEGEDCGGGHLERERSFCCDPPDGASPFLPVPLEYLFEDPPAEDEADTDFSLKVDNTWGGSNDVPLAETPENSAFGFVVLTSPEELQVSLDKRDGSHWDVFDCFDARTEGEHRVRMVCTDQSDASNCHKIHLGRGAPGTIVQMPDGCGPGKYAVVKTLSPSGNQSWPSHLQRRGSMAGETIYDLVFDYDFRRVPRDLGDTQMRIDYSNEPEYWSRVVDKAADHKKARKRSLGDVGGSYKRWLEEEWRDDVHFGALSTEEIHRRWFGEDVVDWLKGLIDGVSGGLDISHSYSEDFILQIIDQRIQCSNVEAKLDVHAETRLDLDVNYGFTLIAKLGGDNGLDFSDSYLYFRNRGEVTAKFVVDAAVTAMFDTGDVLLFSADRFGAAFAVPGIVTIGPNFKLFGRLEGEATLGVNFESRVKLAEWDVRQTYPVADDDWDPEASKSPKKDGTQNTLEPEFSYGVSLNGHLSAHVKPTITFGIDFNEKFISIDPCAVNLVADGHVTFHAELESGSDGTSFCYGIDAGADLYATLEAPEAFSWALPKSPFPIVPIDDVQIYPTNGKSACTTIDNTNKRSARPRSINGSALWWKDDAALSAVASTASASSSSSLRKRAQVYGPLVPRIDGLLCPGDIDLDDIPSCPLCSSDEKRDELGGSCFYDPDVRGYPTCSSDDAEKRDLDGGRLNVLEKRASKTVAWTYNGEDHNLPCGTYKSCGQARYQVGVQKWYGYRGSDRQCNVGIEKLSVNEIDPEEFVTEHIYEAQLLKIFMLWLVNGDLPVGYTNPTYAWVSEVLIGFESPQGTSRPFQAGSWVEQCAFFEMTYGLGGDHNIAGLVLADEIMNSKKEKLFELKMPSSDNGDSNLASRLRHRYVHGVFSYMRDATIWSKFKTSSQFMEKVLHEFDGEYPWGAGQPENDGEPELPSRSAQQPQAGLRDLYCFWIDKHLSTMEMNAASWLNSATDKFKAEYGSDENGIKWLASVLNPKGLISAGNMKFLASATKHGAENPSSPVIWKQSNYDGLWRSDQGYGAAGPF